MNTAQDIKAEIEKLEALYKEKVKAERRSAIDEVKEKIKTYSFHPSEIFSKTEILEQVSRYRVGVDVKPTPAPIKIDGKTPKTTNKASKQKEAPPAA